VLKNDPHNDLIDLTLDMAGRLKVAAALSGKRPEAWMEFVVSLALNVPVMQLASGVALAREAKKARAS
jgi:hypothetical protein